MLINDSKEKHGSDTAKDGHHADCLDSRAARRFLECLIQEAGSQVLYVELFVIREACLSADHVLSAPKVDVVVENELIVDRCEVLQLVEPCCKGVDLGNYMEDHDRILL